MVDEILVNRFRSIFVLGNETFYFTVHIKRLKQSLLKITLTFSVFIFLHILLSSCVYYL